MKKTTLLFLLISSFAFSQVLSEDFEGGLTLPLGWTNNDIAGGGDIWTFDNSPDAIPNNWGPENGFYYNFGMLAGNYALFDSDGYGDNGITENAALESPQFSCVGLSNVTLAFNHFFTDGFGGQGFVEVFNGSTWVGVTSYGLNLEYGYVTIDVTSDLAGVANARVRFRWVGNYAWGWAFDNVSVFECSLSAPGAVINPNPSNGATNLAFDNSDPINYPNRIYFSWSDPLGSDPADSYNFNLGTTNPPTDITFTNFINGDFVYGFDPNTTYYWSIDAINCADTTAGPVWSFTTEATASIEDNVFSGLKVISQINSIALYNLKQSFKYNVYNLTGQHILEGKTENNRHLIEASTLSSGIYILELNEPNSNAILRKKIVLK